MVDQHVKNSYDGRHLSWTKPTTSPKWLVTNLKLGLRVYLLLAETRPASLRHRMVARQPFPLPGLDVPFTYLGVLTSDEETTRCPSRKIFGFEDSFRAALTAVTITVSPTEYFNKTSTMPELITGSCTCRRHTYTIPKPTEMNLCRMQQCPS